MVRPTGAGRWLRHDGTQGGAPAARGRGRGSPRSVSACAGPAAAGAGATAPACVARAAGLTEAGRYGTPPAARVKCTDRRCLCRGAAEVTRPVQPPRVRRGTASGARTPIAGADSDTAGATARASSSGLRQGSRGAPGSTGTAPGAACAAGAAEVHRLVQPGDARPGPQNLIGRPDSAQLPAPRASRMRIGRRGSRVRGQGRRPWPGTPAGCDCPRLRACPAPDGPGTGGTRPAVGNRPRPGPRPGAMTRSRREPGAPAEPVCVPDRHRGGAVRRPTASLPPPPPSACPPPARRLPPGSPCCAIRRCRALPARPRGPPPPRRRPRPR